ncbi:Putative MO25-like protein [Zea mays]|uniref:Putative MO25-like protein n=1 Tax=Zea mays TaxID=4577 RepID=A0A1D6II24_MAIZE|nr:Putative MO25-like protein [Zea mays]
MKGLFKSKPRTPVDIVRQTRECLVYLDLHSDSRSGDAKREEKMTELSKNIRDMKSILYGNGESEPVTEACVQLTQEFFRENTLRLLIIHLPKLNLEVCNLTCFCIYRFYTKKLIHSYGCISTSDCCRLGKMLLKLLQTCKDSKYPQR